jgi:hypothetical protein
MKNIGAKQSISLQQKPTLYIDKQNVIYSRLKD